MSTTDEFAVRISDRSKMVHKNLEQKLRCIKQTKNYSTDTPGPPMGVNISLGV